LSSLKSLFQHTIVYGLATVLPRLLTLLLTPLLTEYLPDTDAFGKVSIIFSYILLSNVVLTYGMETAFFRFFSDAAHKATTRSTALISLLVTTIIFAGLGWFFLEEIAAMTEIDAVYWQWVIGVIAFDTLMVIPFAYMRAQNKSLKYALIKLLNVVITTGTAAVFLIWLPEMDAINDYLPSDKIELYFIAFLAASIITCIIVSRPYFMKWEFDPVLWKKMVRYGAPILIAGLAFAVNETFDKILLQKLLPEDIAESQVAIYSACYRLSVGMTLFATAFKLGVEPFFFSESSNKNATYLYAQITKMFVILGTIALFIYVVLVDIIKPLLLTKEVYWQAMDIVPVILIAYLFFGIYQTISVWYKVTDKTRYGAYISVAGAVLTIAINILLIPEIGYLASAIATCAAYGLMMVASYVLGRKHLAVPYDLKNILLYLTISIVFTVVYFYGFRAHLEIGSWQLYLVGAIMSGILIGIIGIREKTMFLRLIRRR